MRDYSPVACGYYGCKKFKTCQLASYNIVTFDQLEANSCGPQAYSSYVKVVPTIPQGQWKLEQKPTNPPVYDDLMTWISNIHLTPRTT